MYADRRRTASGTAADPLMSVLRPGGGQIVLPRSQRWPVATFVGHSRFERICHAAIEEHALLLEPTAERRIYLKRNGSAQ
jgi:hypothetical protein